jgi:hypothetical protein
MSAVTERPRYRVVKDDGVYANGQVYPKGAEITFDGWPRHGLEPLNAEARRIHRYYTRRHAAWGGLPASPWSAAHRDFWLPGLPLQLDGAEPAGFVPDHEVDPTLPALPEYELTMPHWCGKIEFQAGEHIRWIGWPADDMTAVNHPGRLVAAYFAEHREHPRLEARGPWCWFKGLHLPKLERRTPRVPTPGENVGAIASEVEMATDRPGSRGGRHFGRAALPPYADPQYRHMFKDVVSTRANKARPLPARNQE